MRSKKLLAIVLLVPVVLVTAVLGFLLGRDALAAGQHRAETPPVLDEELYGPSSPEGDGSVPALTTENSPRDQRDPSPRAVVPFTPDQIFIPEADVNTTVDPRPATNVYNEFIGDVVLTFPVPDGPFTTVWWDEGPKPGDGELAVILGHARSPRAAVFNELLDLEEGASLALTGATDEGEGVAARYRVEQVVSGISKTDAAALRAVLDSPPPDATLALITCSGTLDEVLSSRTDNTVVFASLTTMTATP